ncbi:FKBP-type peptidyl-prolyl cis-trans isomerase [Rhizosphaericola mali]|uniref:Peptidyl-prolyl cis-trans isomerase n=1 Tax=Rhizosphaericola mali TaxID=2545455 RepID=A0A5P2G0P9_9BACT|nr:FKBP-type peptidyl-prolyl cis-trans isomerase [Rhizosphaericola mali]QES88228.1 FKBP-type peptidyl-prolyl cis-trans isomerase [Rhizosphaericola mali]
MKKYRLIFVGIGALSTLCTLAQTKKKISQIHTTAKKHVPTTKSVVLKNQFDSLSYAIGISMAKFYKAQGVENLNIPVLNKAIEDGMHGDSTLLSEDQANTVMMQTAQRMSEKKAEGNIKAGEEFLEKNKRDASVVVLPDGLQYKILTPGTGLKPTLQDTVKVHYTGKLIDGTVFDSSVDRGEPLDIPVSGVIKGWTEALQLMPVGSKWRLYIPSALAYGNRQAGPVIKPGSALVFDVELISIANK